MRDAIENRSAGFSMVELLVSLAIMIPLVGAALLLFSTGVNQHFSEQDNSAMNQEVRTALEEMTLEIAQAGAHGYVATTTAAAITGSGAAQSLPVVNSGNFNTGDWVDVGTGSNKETVPLTAVGSTSIMGIFRASHASGIPVRLFPYPYLTGIVPPAGLGSNSSTNTTVLRFYGDINNDGTVQYVEYSYDGNTQISRSMTPLSQTNKNAAQPFIRNIVPGTAQFTLYTDNQAAVTSVRVSLTVRSTWQGNGSQQSRMASRIDIPSIAAASALLTDLQQYGGVSHLPPTPPRVATWAGS